MMESNNDIFIKDIYPNGKFNEKSAIIIKDSKEKLQFIYLIIRGLILKQEK